MGLLNIRVANDSKTLLDDKALEAEIFSCWGNTASYRLFYSLELCYSRDNSVILNIIQAYDLDVELGHSYLVFNRFVSVRHSSGLRDLSSNRHEPGWFQSSTTS